MKTAYYLIACLSLFFLTLSIAFAELPPTLPTVLQGKLLIDENSAPIGTEINAEIDGRLAGSTNTTKGGLYIISVSGSTDDSGKPIKLFVNGIDANINATWEPSKVETINLSITKKNNAYLYAAAIIIILILAFIAFKAKKKK